MTEHFRVETSEFTDIDDILEALKDRGLYHENLLYRIFRTEISGITVKDVLEHGTDRLHTPSDDKFYNISDEDFEIIGIEPMPFSDYLWLAHEDGLEELFPRGSESGFVSVYDPSKMEKIPIETYGYAFKDNDNKADALVALIEINYY